MEDAIHLLSEYKAFIEASHSRDLALFGEWLKQKHASPNDYKTGDDEVNEAGPDVIASYLLGMLAGFTEVWTKITFADVPLHSLSDFIILETIKEMEHPSKSEVANRVVMEQSTCIETIKRLVKKELLDEKTDANDRRIKRVSLSEKGSELLELLEQQRMPNLGKLLVGQLNDVEKKQMIGSLKKLFDFHQNLYLKRNEIDIAATFGLNGKN